MRRDIRSEMCCYSVLEHRRKYFLDFYRGTVFPGSLFLLCSDGFRHEISEQELYMQLQPSVLTTEEMMKERLVYLTELVKSRMEMDTVPRL
ncbi:MAG: hypothetical protein ACLVAT_05315 [Lachnospiraceae bacterium]